MIPLTMSSLIVVIALLPASVFGQDMSGVTGAGAGSFPASTTFNGVSVTGLQFGTGVFIPTGAPVAGQFETTLLGISVLGQPQNIAILGNASSGLTNADGSRSISGTVSLDMGDGTPPLSGVPLTIRATSNILLLTVGVNNLPLASLTVGSIIID